MKLSEALDLANRPAQAGSPAKTVSLVCGFTPLHLVTFLQAYGRLRFAESGVAPAAGLYGDLLGNLKRAASESAEIALVLEWSDLDPRLGFREFAGWTSAVLEDIASEVEYKLEQIASLLESRAYDSLVAILPPSLPLPPVGHTTGAQASWVELRLNTVLQQFLERAGDGKNVRVIRSAKLDTLSPSVNRLDVKGLWASGFPYTLTHADAVAKLIVEVLYPVTPKKGLITDLDNTLWKGIVGEIGVAAIKWDHASNAQAHALYAQMLASLAENGVLLAIASKNERELVEEALRRDDMLIRSHHFFPMEVNWGAKSASVERILEAWNISADSVVFVDDNPMELEEVQARYPETTCLLFPSKPAEVLGLLEQLRDLFGKPSVGEEDRVRASSLRAAAEVRASGADFASPEFLKRLAGTVTLQYSRDARHARALELINKTNQFNLNGIRYTQGEWIAHLGQPESFLATVRYTDKFGSLGEIAVITGLREGSTLHVKSWVMSCRAFSRAIENHTLERLFSHFEAAKLRFDFKPTERNTPTQDFFEQLPHSGYTLTREQFFSAAFALPHHVKELNDGSDIDRTADVLLKSVS